MRGPAGPSRALRAPAPRPRPGPVRGSCPAKSRKLCADGPLLRGRVQEGSSAPSRFASAPALYKRLQSLLGIRRAAAPQTSAETAPVRPGQAGPALPALLCPTASAQRGLWGSSGTPSSARKTLPTQLNTGTIQHFNPTENVPLHDKANAKKPCLNILFI